MYILRTVTTILVSVFLFSSSNAHSTERNPLTYLSHVENAEIKTPSHRVNAFSKFDLFFDLHEGRQRIKLTLAPNHDVIQDGATIPMHALRVVVRFPALLRNLVPMSAILCNKIFSMEHLVKVAGSVPMVSVKAQVLERKLRVG